MRRYAGLVLFFIISTAYADLSDFNARSHRQNKESEHTKSPRVHQVDQYLVERSKAYEKVKLNIRAECAKVDFAKQLNCMAAIRKDFDEKFPNRGTEEYVKKFYIKFNKEQAKAKQMELQKLLTTVHFVKDKKNGDTELLHDMVKGELLYLEELVLKIDPIPYGS